MKVDEGKLNQFVEKAVTDLAAGYGGVMTALGNNSDFIRQWLMPDRSIHRKSPNGRVAPSATCANGSIARRRPVTFFITPPAPPTSSHRSRRWCWRKTTARYSCRLLGKCRLRCLSTKRKPSMPFAPERRRLGRARERLFRGVAAFYRNGYRNSLVREWLPALRGVEEKLHAGAKVADVGCGHGHSTILMAEAFPQSRFWGFDYHEKSIDRARSRLETRRSKIA